MSAKKGSNALTDKQERFVQELLKGKSQREAYRAAYNCEKALNTTIDSKASVLFAQEKVRARYNALHDAVINASSSAAIATAAQVLEELTAIALGTKNFPGVDMFGNPVERPPSMTARIKALELMGRNHKLFTDNVSVGNNGEGAFRVDISVVE